MVLTAAVSSAPAQTTAADAWDMPVAEALDRAATTGRPVAVLITGGAWCDPCRWLADNTLTSPQIETETAGRWHRARLSDTDPAFAEFEVERLPTILFLAPDGTELSRTVGAVTVDTVVDEMQRVRQRRAEAGGGGTDEAVDASAGVAAPGATGADAIRGREFRIAAGTIGNDGGATWYTQDAGLPPRLEEYDQDEAFLYLRDESSGTILAITVVDADRPALWRWDTVERTWVEVGDLEPLDR